MDIGTCSRLALDRQCKKTPVFIQSQLCPQIEIPRMRFAEHPLHPLCRPQYRAADQPRRRKKRRLFRDNVDACTKGSTDIRYHHPQLFARNA